MKLTYTEVTTAALLFFIILSAFLALENQKLSSALDHSQKIAKIYSDGVKEFLDHARKDEP